MRDLIEAIMARLATATSAPVYFVDVPERPDYPYTLLWSPPGGLNVDDAPLGGPLDDVDALVGVTAVAVTPGGVLDLHKTIRANLCPEGRPTPLTAAGRVSWLTIEPGYGQPVEVDREVFIPMTSRHPAFGVEMYRLRSIPA